MFKMVGKDDGKSATYEINVIMSLQWPGFCTIVNTDKQRWSHLYLGLGIKANQVFIPEKPKDFMKEPNDLTEVKEVTNFYNSHMTSQRLKLQKGKIQKTLTKKEPLRQKITKKISKRHCILILNLPCNLTILSKTVKPL